MVDVLGRGGGGEASLCVGAEDGSAGRGYGPGARAINTVDRFEGYGIGREERHGVQSMGRGKGKVGERRGSPRGS